ncbi:Inositol 2-dehydrogenase/D-chiro-inositol 3-dehydrogenase [Candidatus Lokiarchaeum ossiferum]|uniref:Inositol 2-dehydrogenase/D-chiro-inositol 3-dehydrogenase n=1 Tax=Candidatus Lokiarchaeum ossiferum TaxID=2951803 RepID=A0ABY6HMT4_9ARCH|nr:Inositol 2-dehydrogenase/D-chiro-inositol 3-dehydrogenase [Candidatus Lokiarchaeum sp. B-35]
MNSTRTPVTGIMIGAGNRGVDAYGLYALEKPHRLKMIAVAEPIPEKRKRYQSLHNIPDSHAYTNWEDILNPTVGKIADVVFICTQDDKHFFPTKMAIELGYHILLEKPISPHLAECQELVKLRTEKDQYIQVGHVLRYTEFWKSIKNVVDSGRIGRIIHYDHSENVSFWHFGHSFVRGNWKNKATSSPLILAKSCHDLDLMFWLIGKQPLNVQSTGNLSHYRPENAPENAADRCTDGCSHASTCPWYAPSLYLRGKPIIQEIFTSSNKFLKFLAKIVLKHRKLAGHLFKLAPKYKSFLDWKDWPSSIITTDLTVEGRMKALREGPYGKCIYKTGNDVVDHQVSTFNFPSGVTGTLTVHGLSDIEGREIRIFGTKGSIRGVFRAEHEEVVVTNFSDSIPITVYKTGMNMAGHGGGDFGMMDAFTSVLLGVKSPEKAGYADIETAMESHFMAFAAEEARITQETIKMNLYR